jgi:hypothetical protein
VCRKAHVTLYWVAKQLGFFVIDLERQFIGAVEEDKMLEVRNGLWFTDLAIGAGPSLRVRDRLQTAVRSSCGDVAPRWRETALDTEAAQAIHEAAKAGDDVARAHVVQRLRETTINRGWGQGW